MEKAWLSQNKIEFEDRDVTEDPEAMAELQERGLFTTPVTVINDQTVVGFDRDKLAELLEIDSSG
ncbi:MAG: glutaredoxin family protein [Anaerolineales bacterium]|nr:glutaredoxin family protein [Anaerolineales bacterium]